MSDCHLNDSEGRGRGSGKDERGAGNQCREVDAPMPEGRLALPHLAGDIVAAWLSKAAMTKHGAWMRRRRQPADNCPGPRAAQLVAEALALGVEDDATHTPEGLARHRSTSTLEHGQIRALRMPRPQRRGT